MKTIHRTASRRTLLLLLLGLVMLILAAPQPVTNATPQDPWEDDPDFSDAALAFAPSCTGASVGVVSLYPGNKCCYTEYVSAKNIRFDINIIPSLVTPRGKIKIFRDGALAVSAKFRGLNSYSFTGGGPFNPHFYKVCAKYPTTEAVDFSFEDLMHVENSIIE